MISLRALATVYAARTVDADGFDLEGEPLRSSVERAIRADIDASSTTIARLLPEETCPNAYRGELRSARHRLKVASADLVDVTAMRLEVTAAE
ncbi:MAG TPA: hypothetical protein VL494_13455 [Steroidobacteraceae bacterium]|nr:hypothetical protein [Steroidobacteraceae bacterium]